MCILKVLGDPIFLFIGVLIFALLFAVVKGI